MNDEERGALLVRQEDLHLRISALRQEIKETGRQFGSLVHQMVTAPEDIVLLNAPPELVLLPVVPSELSATAAPHDWERLTAAMNLEHIAGRIQQLRAMLMELNEVTQRLAAH